MGTDDKWLTPSETGIGDGKLNPLQSVTENMPSGGTEDSLFVDVEQLMTFAGDIAELAGEYGKSLKSGLIDPMQGGAGTVRSSGLLYQSSLFADKYFYALDCVSKMFGEHANGLMATYSMGMNAAVGYINGDFNGGTNIAALEGEGADPKKLLFNNDGSPVTPPKDAMKEAEDRKATEEAVKDILESQGGQTENSGGDGDSPTAPEGATMAGDENYKLPQDSTDRRGAILTGGKENSDSQWNSDSGMIIAYDDEQVEVDMQPPKD